MTFEEWWAKQPKDPTKHISPREAWKAATLVEREACAKVCEELMACDEYDPGESFADAIRNRSNAEPTTEKQMDKKITTYAEFMAEAERLDPEGFARARNVKLTCEQILAWADRNDIARSLMELRCMVEDARSLTPNAARTGAAD